jgi:4-oxalocrotonate tautomerase
MPEVYIYMADGRTVDQKRAVAREVTDSIAKNLNVPADAVIVQFVEAPRDSKARGGVLFSEAPPPKPAGT